jgi:hypothetical protein
VRRFGVSMSQASADIARYLAHDPPGVIYDRSAKRYAAQTDFRPLLGKPDATRFLGELRLVEAGILAIEDTMLGVVPRFDATPVPERRIDPLVLRAVLFAIRGHKSLDVAYQSMSRREAIRRVIEPHALAYDGFRWHARAFDRESGAFRDFVLGRMSKPNATAKPRYQDDPHAPAQGSCCYNPTRLPPRAPAPESSGAGCEEEHMHISTLYESVTKHLSRWWRISDYV